METEEMSRPRADKSSDLARELKNFQEIASYITPQPGDIPNLSGFDIYGKTMPLNGVAGGDHIIYSDFKARYDLDARVELARERGQEEVARNLLNRKHVAGIALVDVSGHRVTDALLAAMFHQAFLLGSIYELDAFGEITEQLFENLNSRFYNSSSVNKYLTMLYAEITEDARFRFLSAAHPAPLVFSERNDCFMAVHDEYCTTSPPLGMMPSKHVVDHSTTKSALGFKGHYDWNEWVLMGRGDILLMSTDGLLEHSNGDETYVPSRLEEVLRRVKRQNAKEIVTAIQEDLVAFGPPVDDITIVVIKRS